MRTLIKTTLLSCCLLLYSGCATIHGSWKTVHVMPPDAVKDFTLGTACFKPDGTYEATMEYGGQKRESKGTYKYAGDTLTLMPEGGQERQYTAKLCCGGCKLCLSHEYKGQTVTVMMKKSCASKCGKGKCCSDRQACGSKKKCHPSGCKKPCGGEAHGKKPHGGEAHGKKPCGGKKAACKPGCTMPCCKKT